MGRLTDMQIGENLMTPLTQARASAFQEFVASVNANANGVTTAAAVPQAVGVGFGYNIHDLRSIGNYEWSGAAPMEASLIYYVGCPDDLRRANARSSLHFTSHCLLLREG